MNSSARCHAALLPIVFGVAMVASACSGSSSSGTTLPTTPTTTTTTATFTDSYPGTLTVNGAVTNHFNVQGAGTVTATLTTVNPDSSLPVGFSLGTWSTTSNVCAVALANDQATQGSIITGSTSAAGAICVRIYDVGNLTASESFVITVSHP